VVSATGTMRVRVQETRGRSVLAANDLAVAVSPNLRVGVNRMRAMFPTLPSAFTPRRPDSNYAGTVGVTAKTSTGRAGPTVRAEAAVGSVVVPWWGAW